MTWKSYAAVSAGTVLAGWLAAQAPSNTVTPAPPAATPAETAGTSGPSQIELEAERLQARVRQQIEYQDPARNPFRFNGRSTPAPAPSVAAPIAEAVIPAPVPVVPLPPPIKLTGIAEDRVGEGTQRRAFLSSPSGILLVREGDQVLGQYTVGRIDADSVELVGADGTITRLTTR